MKYDVFKCKELMLWRPQYKIAWKIQKKSLAWFREVMNSNISFVYQRFITIINKISYRQPSRFNWNNQVHGYRINNKFDHNRNSSIPFFNMFICTFLYFAWWTLITPTPPYYHCKNQKKGGVYFYPMWGPSVPLS